MMIKWSLINASDLYVMETNKLTIQNRYTDRSPLEILFKSRNASPCVFLRPLWPKTRRGKSPSLL